MLKTKILVEPFVFKLIKFFITIVTDMNSRHGSNPLIWGIFEFNSFYCPIT